MHLYGLLLATLAAIFIPVAASPQTLPSAKPMGEETYVIDSRGTTVYRNGVPVCRINCGDGASAGDRERPQEPAPAVPAFADPAPLDGSRTVAAAAPPETRLREPAAAGLTKKQKAVLLNAGVVAAVTAYGVGYWDYFQTAPKASSEGWFGRTTSSGGMDKLGHSWTSYSVANLYSYVYRWWDIDDQTANTLGALSSFGIQTVIELGDAFSGDYGFSYEDAIMNAMGAGAAYIRGRYPSLARKVDFRLEYKPSKLSDLTNDLLTDYENQRYLIALKLDGFDMFHESALSYLELHAGYQARGYEGHIVGSDDDDRRRSYYFGVGFNVSKLVQNYVNLGVFDYLQIPYTSGGVTSGID